VATAGGTDVDLGASSSFLRPAVEAVVLLNTPDLCELDIRLWHHLKSRKQCVVSVCADGAFSSVIKHFRSGHFGSSPTGATLSSAPTTSLASILPNFVCGDFDSLEKGHRRSVEVSQKRKAGLTASMLMEDAWVEEGSATTATDPAGQLPSMDSTLEEIATVADLTKSSSLGAAMNDTAPSTSKNMVRFVRIKDQDCTDFDKCMHLILSYLSMRNLCLGVTRVVVLGSKGGRLDHELSALNALCRFAAKNCSCPQCRAKEVPQTWQVVLSAPTHTTLCCPPGTDLWFRRNTAAEGKVVGVIPMCGPRKGIELVTEGLKWNFDPSWTKDTECGWGALISTSNEIAAKNGIVRLSNGPFGSSATGLSSNQALSVLFTINTSKASRAGLGASALSGASAPAPSHL
jgi:thiamine pyrophosphokinase